MSIKRMLCLFLGVVILGLGIASCSYAKGSHENLCKNPQFGKAEEGFVNCKSEDAFVRLSALAKRDDPKALYMLSRIYEMGGKYFGLPSIKQDGDVSMKYLLHSAKGGYAEAQATLGVFYWRDYRETREHDALYWECRAALQNNYEGIVNTQMHIQATGKAQTVQQYCAPILKSPPPDAK